MKSKVEIQNHLNIPESKEDMVQMLTEFNVLVDFLASNIDMISTKHFFVYQGGGHTAVHQIVKGEIMPNRILIAYKNI